MNRFFITGLVLGLLGSAAHAGPITFTFEDVAFGSGAEIAGSFTVDFDAEEVTDFSFGSGAGPLLLCEDATCSTGVSPSGSTDGAVYDTLAFGSAWTDSSGVEQGTLLAFLSSTSDLRLSVFVFGFLDSGASSYDLRFSPEWQCPSTPAGCLRDVTTTPFRTAFGGRLVASTAVSEPATLFLFGLGLIGLALRRR